MSDEFDELSRKIARAREMRQASPENLQAKAEDEESNREMSFGMRVAVELVAGIIVGVLIGFFLDRWFHTMPLFLIIFMLVGAAGGFWNIYKLAFQGQSDKNPPR